VAVKELLKLSTFTKVIAKIKCVPFLWLTVHPYIAELGLPFNNKIMP